MSAFSDHPLVAGSVVGIRSFDVDLEGRLCGVAQCLPWKAGENLASCQPPMLYRGPRTEGPHEAAHPDCGCGFYGFFTGTHEYGRPERIAGIIEGYGIVTVGARGFRAAKARILALVRPGDTACGCFDCARIRLVFTDVLANYPSVPVYDTQEAAIEAHPLTKPADCGVEPAPEPRDGWQSLGWVTAGGPVVNTTQVHAAFRQLQQATQQAINAFRQDFTTLADALQNTPAAPPKTDATLTPVERKRAQAEAAAQRRAQAGLSNIGGIDRRRRKP